VDRITHRHEHIPQPAAARPDARPAPFGHTAGDGAGADLQLPPPMAQVAERRPRLSLIAALKLLFAALGAGGRVVPLGDNGRTTRLLSQYAASLRDH
jgi:hypothetical protein